MKNFAKRYASWYRNLSKGAKILMCLLWDIPANIYRFSLSAIHDNTMGMILAVVVGLLGGWITGIIDITSIAAYDKVGWLDNYESYDRLAINQNDSANSY